MRVSKLSNIGPDNVFTAVRRQAFIWTNAGLLLAGHLRKKSENI